MNREKGPNSNGLQQVLRLCWCHITLITAFHDAEHNYEPMRLLLLQRLLLVIPSCQSISLQ